MDDGTRDVIADLRDDMDRQAQQYERAASRLRPVSATDSSRSVTVRLDESGAVRSVTVTDAWRTELGSEGLGAGVLEAYGAAGAERVRGWGGAAAEQYEQKLPEQQSAMAAIRSEFAVGGVVIALVALGAGVAALNAGASSANNTVNQAATYGLSAWPTFALS